jgi:hypothetical protein
VPWTILTYMETRENKRQIENEQHIRDRNESTKNGLKNFFHSDKEIVEAPIDFVCECSALDCDEHVNLSIDDYEKIHSRADRFVIYKGHSTPAIEKVIVNDDSFDTVEKYDLAP